MNKTGSFNLIARKVFNTAMPIPNSKVSNMHIQTGSPVITNKVAHTTPQVDMAYPTDKSMEPDIIRNVMPSDTTIRYEFCDKILMILFKLKKLSEVTPKIVHIIIKITHDIFRRRKSLILLLRFFMEIPSL
jgi:hypothetical protein